MNLSIKIRSTLVFLGLVLPSTVICAQVITTSIDISPKVKVENILPLTLEPYPDFDTGTLLLKGVIAWQITTHENILVSARATHDGKLINQTGHELPLSTWLAYCNHDTNPHVPPSQGQNNNTQFTMSDSRLLIQNMNPRPNLLKAYLFLGAKTTQPTMANTPYAGSIFLNIELN